MNDQNRAIEMLKNLAETCRDGQHGFIQAAEHVKNPELRAFFNELATERARFAGELENELIHHGKHDPSQKGTAAGSLHRAWLSVKDALGRGDHGILSSVEAAEDKAKEQYEDALEADLPQDIRDIISRQARSIFAAHDRVRDLRNRYEHAA